MTTVSHDDLVAAATVGLSHRPLTCSGRWDRPTVAAATRSS